MAGLTQAEVAHRAGVTQQTIAQYERGARAPSVNTLTSLIAGCGLELSWHLIPHRGLEDEPTRDLLKLPMLRRLHEPLAHILQAIFSTGAADKVEVLLGGKVGARLNGANVRVYDLEFWVDAQADPNALTEFLAAADVVDVGYSGASEPAVIKSADLRDGYIFAGPGADVHIRSVERFRQRVGRAQRVELPGGTGSFFVAAPWDCAIGWHDRDLDHLALQRAVRLAADNQSVMPRE